MTTFTVYEKTRHPNRLWFDFNGGSYDYILADRPGPVDFALGPVQNLQPRINLRLDIWHGYNDKLKDTLAHLRAHPELVIITESYDPNIQDDRIIYNDFVFNRTKAYYSHFPVRPGTERWYHYSHLSYIMLDLSTPEHKKKIFVSPTKFRDGFRPQLLSLMANYRDLGYIGSRYTEENRILYAHLEFPFEGYSIEELEQQTRPPSYDNPMYSPPHNEYYNNTFISIYCETVEQGDTLFITEKTFDPLIKGHFILPFSSPGFVQYVRSKGFLLPDFIDYSYDSIRDGQSRFDAYASEIRRLMTIDLDGWKQHWMDNLDLLYHNKRLFYDRDYDRVDMQTLLDKFS